MPGLHAEGVPSLEDKVRFLSRASSYPHGPDRVDAKETHMSWVFLAGDRVFKLKKPVWYPYLDFSSLQARKRYCGEENRLNHRLAPGIYRGVVPLMRSSSGALSLGGEGEVVDWLVEMRRLPAGCMLDSRLKEGAVSERDIERLAAVLADFYRGAEHPPVDPDWIYRHYEAEMADNRAVLMRQDLLPEQASVVTVLNRAAAVLLKSRKRLRERVQGGHIVDGHGDLRPEHICLVDPLVIFDCLEFSRDLRLVDPFDEMAFLGLECARLGASSLGSSLIGRVAQLMGEDVPTDLIGVYTVLHALLRARLSLAHLMDPVPREPRKWAPLTRQYLGLAEEALSALC